MSEVYKIVSEIERNQIIAKIAKGKRLDGRSLDEYRPIKIETGIVSKADGSAKVELGDTKVIVGIKIELGEPFPDTPEEGVITLSAELLPMAFPTFEPGPPNFDAIELARVVDRGIRHSDIIDRRKLCIIPGKKVWILFVDIYVLDSDGNLFDASSIAAIAALKNLKIPEVKVSGEEVEIVKDSMNPIHLKGKLAAVTIAKVGDYLIVDPDSSEERIMDARITVAFNHEGKICAIQKGGESSFKYPEIQKAIELANKSSEKIFNELSKVV
ncbi:MAG: exosome complex protein Rrp42 [Candidatus Odinarchaeum yellowstonii]|uniref:Exosome complex component Rrp42 n=1 Tax=Odinarchaeota yellowstonii (strain LCB_4) TaxID=1841599 RepID=A0AAF0D3M8_ODILC|nr:MAG: exosome complex protein Rrp42 [Candidatus Odinarchaeum yellowstonii]